MSRHLGIHIKLLLPQAGQARVSEKVALPKSARQDSNPQHASSVPSNTSVLLSLVDLNKISDIKIAMPVCPHWSHGWRFNLTAVTFQGWKNSYLINDFWLTVLRKLQETDVLLNSGYSYKSKNRSPHHTCTEGLAQMLVLQISSPEVKQLTPTIPSKDNVNFKIAYCPWIWVPFNTNSLTRLLDTVNKNDATKQQHTQQSTFCGLSYKWQQMGSKFWLTPGGMKRKI